VKAFACQEWYVYHSLRTTALWRLLQLAWSTKFYSYWKNGHWRLCSVSNLRKNINLTKMLTTRWCAVLSSLFPEKSWGFQINKLTCNAFCVFVTLVLGFISTMLFSLWQYWTLVEMLCLRIFSYCIVWGTKFDSINKTLQNPGQVEASFNVIRPNESNS